MTSDFLGQLVFVFFVSASCYWAFLRLRIGEVGLLLAGILIVGLGPKGANIAPSVSNVAELAEIGVVLMLFSVGLQLSVDHLIAIGRTVVVGGTIQILSTATIVFAILLWFAVPAPTAICVGFFTAMSSTVIGVRHLGMRNEIDSPHGRAAMGILVAQDLAVLPLALLLPLLGNQPQVGGSAAQLQIVREVLVLVAIYAAGRWIVDPIFDLVAQTRDRVLFLMALLVVCIGAAWASSVSGISPALGAFVAGTSLSRSKYFHEVRGGALPFQMLFGSLFFVAVGMLVDLGVAVQEWQLILSGVFVVIAVKLLTGIGSLLFLGHPLRVALTGGSLLAQTGELSFVLSLLSLEAGLLSKETYQIFNAIAVLTMALSPVVAATGRKLASLLPDWRFEYFFRYREQNTRTSLQNVSGHVIIAGYGIAGHLVVRTLQNAKLSFVVVELNAKTVDSLTKQGIPCVLGDCAKLSVLQDVGIERAGAIVMAINDREAVQRAVKMVHRHCPNLPIIARVPFLSGVNRIRSLGATQVIPEDLATGIVVAARTAEAVGVEPLPSEDLDQLIQAVANLNR